MSGGYYDPEAILADDTPVPTTFMYSVSTLGKLLEPNTSSRDLPRDSKVDLPLWLARPLQERNIASVGMPGAYNERFQRRAEAGPSCLNLRAHPYFYKAGLECSALTQDVQLCGVLRQVFTERYKELLSGSLKAPDGAELQAVLIKLNEEERQLYEAGRVGAARQEEWWGHGGRAPISSRVGGKRRRPEGGLDKENQPKERKKN